MLGRAGATLGRAAVLLLRLGLYVGRGEPGVDPNALLVECSFHDGGSDCVATRLQLGTGSLWQA